MKEYNIFNPIKNEVERKQDAKALKPLTIDQYQAEDDQPMSLKDHWQSLRLSIQEKVSNGEQLSEEYEKAKVLRELISPELLSEYKKLIDQFGIKTKKTENHPEREYIDIENKDQEYVKNINEWIGKLVIEVSSNREIEFEKKDIEELRSQCWLFFDSVANVINTRSIEKDIEEFYAGENGEDKYGADLTRGRNKIIKELKDRYPLEQNEIEIIVDLVHNSASRYSPKILAKAIAELWGQYELSKKKGAISKISVGYLASRGLHSFSPSLFEGMLQNDQFRVSVFIEYMGLNTIADAIDVKNKIEVSKLMNEVNQQINERITNSLFFQEFEFMHEKSLGEIFSTLERGKAASRQMLESAISQLGPYLSEIIMSLGFLIKINPVMGAIGVGSLPIMYSIAKKQNEKIWPMYDKERKEGEKIDTEIGSIKSGFEEVKTSSEIPAIAANTVEIMNKRDSLSLQRSIENAKMDFLSMLPFNVSSMVAASVGGVLQSAGMISGGAILSNIQYASRLQNTIHSLVTLYYSEFARYIQDIQQMEKVLGKYEALDLPEGEKEKQRVPVSELKSYDITIKDLKYKDILRGVNLKIKKGEFVTIAGESGAGKSTLLRNIVGLYKSQSGSIEIGGVENSSIKKYGPESIYSIMSYCNQEPQIFEGKTLRENLMLWSKENVDDEKIKKVLLDLHLDKFAGRLDEKISHFSGGEKVRIGVARTLIKGAKIMLLDEPTERLDSANKSEVRNILKEIHLKYPETTIICVTHDQALLAMSQQKIQMEEIH
jgi:ABC-type multidrug transport system fused ATPase/permease subunit